MPRRTGTKPTAAETKSCGRAARGKSVAEAGLRKFYYRVPGIANNIHYQPMAEPLSRYAEFTMDLWRDGNLLTGSFYANDSNSHVGMFGSGGLFEVYTANSDAGMYQAGCENFIDCKGTTGNLVRRQDGDQQLPEPMTLGLTALGLLGMCYSRPR